MWSLLSVALKILALLAVVVSVIGAVVRIRQGEWILLSAQLIGLAFALGLWRLGTWAKRHGSDYVEGSSAR